MSLQALLGVVRHLVVERIVHHGRLLEFAGQSRRVSEALMFGRNASAQPEK